MKRILVVNNYDSFVYNITGLLEKCPDISFDVAYQDRIGSGILSRYDGIIFSPGPGIPRESPGMMRLIDRCRDTHRMLGICLGHQALIEYFGGRLTRLEHPLHGHRAVLTLTDPADPLFRHTGTPLAAGLYHSWTADPGYMPECLSVSSIDERGCIMSVYHRTLPIHGVQFHPESIMTDCGVRILKNWLEI